MKKDQEEMNIADNPLYHDTWKLLKKYRDVVWSLELSVLQVRSRFEIEYGSSIEDFLESVYVAGIDLSDRSIEHHAKYIERSYRMLKLLDTSIDLLRTKHKNGESYYWLLYYSFLSPQQPRNVEEIIEKLRPHIRDISFPSSLPLSRLFPVFWPSVLSGTAGRKVKISDHLLKSPGLKAYRLYIKEKRR